MAERYKIQILAVVLSTTMISQDFWVSGVFRYTEEALGLSFKLLEINPEAYTAWNYRKLALQHNLKELSDPEAIKSSVDAELRVVCADLSVSTLYQILLCSSVAHSQEIKSQLVGSSLFCALVVVGCLPIFSCGI